MIPSDWNIRHNRTDDRAIPHAHPELLAISFVRVSGNSVRGTLEPYRDPVCGCRVQTVFDGRLNGDVITGTYETFHVDTQDRRDGTWTVRRSAAYADARVDGDDAGRKAQ
jgi:hypothetical protein